MCMIRLLGAGTLEIGNHVEEFDDLDDVFRWTTTDLNAGDRLDVSIVDVTDYSAQVQFRNGGIASLPWEAFEVEDDCGACGRLTKPGRTV